MWDELLCGFWVGPQNRSGSMNQNHPLSFCKTIGSLVAFTLLVCFHHCGVLATGSIVAICCLTHDKHFWGVSPGCYSKTSAVLLDDNGDQTKKKYLHTWNN